MSNLFRTSDAASLALHAGMLMAETPGTRRSTSEMAGVLKVSAAHLAKVLQRLEQAGIVMGTRGPSGGYVLARPAKKIALIELYRAVEGKPEDERCPFGVPACDGDACPLGRYFDRLNRQATAKLVRTRLADVHPRLGRQR